MVMSRRAKKFRDQCRSVKARNLIEGAIKKANLSLTAVEFDQLVERACERDENACRNLGRLSQQLAPHLPEKRGRPISAETCTHLILLWWLESSGHKCAYTSSPDNAGFTDPVDSSHAIGLGQRRLQPAICAQAAQERIFFLRFIVRGLIEDRASRRRGARAIGVPKFWPIFHFSSFARFTACLSRLNC